LDPNIGFAVHHSHCSERANSDAYEIPIQDSLED
jgi:hypothetical protein